MIDFLYNLATVWEKKVAYIVDWLKGQLAETHTNGFVLGLSGGLDSSVCAALIKRASDNTLGLILPVHSDVKDLDDAAEIASVVGLPTEYVDLSPVYEHLVKLLPAEMDICQFAYRLNRGVAQSDGFFQIGQALVRLTGHVIGVANGPLGTRLIGAVDGYLLHGAH